ncbi:unnamed protein product [Pylaiella littoralis]
MIKRKHVGRRRSFEEQERCNRLIFQRQQRAKRVNDAFFQTRTQVRALILCPSLLRVQHVHCITISKPPPLAMISPDFNDGHRRQVDPRSSRIWWTRPSTSTATSPSTSTATVS